MTFIAARCKWVFGTQEANLAINPGTIGTPPTSRGPANNVVGSTGAGASFNTHGWGERFSFFMEADAAATGSYQIRTARTSSGPWAVLSSGTLSTSQADVFTCFGPLRWVSPRLKTLNSTANQIVIEMQAVQ